MSEKKAKIKRQLCRILILKYYINKHPIPYLIRKKLIRRLKNNKLELTEKGKLILDGK